ncbi:MAG: YbhN family protein [Halobacteriaceae archaeon]
MEVDVRGVVLSFAAAVVILVALVWVVGIDQVVAAFATLRPRDALLLVVVGLGWLAAWGLALRAVLDVLDVSVGVGTAFLLYASAAFANNVTPFGQAGGEPFSALLISRATGSEYEDGLAAIASVDAINFAPSILLSLAGLGYYAAVVAVGRSLLSVLAVVVGLALAVTAAAVAVWRYRDHVEHRTAVHVGAALQVLGRALPRVDPPTPATVEHKVTSFFGSIERVATSRRDLTLALTFSAAGWACMVGTLWLSLYALGFVVPLAAAMIVVPVGAIASVTPLPGGLGGVEFAIALLIIPTTGVSPATASAAALVYRGATYWLSVVVGGVATAYLEGRDA